MNSGWFDAVGFIQNVSPVIAGIFINIQSRFQKQLFDAPVIFDCVEKRVFDDRSPSNRECFKRCYRSRKLHRGESRQIYRKLDFADVIDRGYEFNIPQSCEDHSSINSIPIDACDKISKAINWLERV